MAGLCNAANLHPAMGLLVPLIQARAGCLIAVQEQQISAEEYDALCKGMRVTTPPPITDDLSRWMNETQWAALQPLTQLPVSLTGASSSWGAQCLQPASKAAVSSGSHAGPAQLHLQHDCSSQTV